MLPTAKYKTGIRNAHHFVSPANFEHLTSERRGNSPGSVCVNMQWREHRVLTAALGGENHNRSREYCTKDKLFHKLYECSPIEGAVPSELKIGRERIKSHPQNSSPSCENTECPSVRARGSNRRKQSCWARKFPFRLAKLPSEIRQSRRPWD